MVNRFQTQWIRDFGLVREGAYVVGTIQNLAGPSAGRRADKRDLP